MGVSLLNSPFPGTTFFYSVACRARYVSPFDAAPQRQGGWHTGKASVQTAGYEYYPEGWRFLAEQRPALLAGPLRYLCGFKRRIAALDMER